MGYEPKGKTLVLFEAMRAAPGQPIWSMDECALVMELPRSSVPPYLKTALEKGALHRRLDSQGRPEFSLKPFPTPAPASDPRAPQFTGWVPSQMSAPRPGSDVRHVNPPRPTAAPAPKTGPARLCPGCDRPVCAKEGCVAGETRRTIGDSSAPASTPAPTQAPVPTPAPAPGPVDAQAPAPAPAPAAEPRVPTLNRWLRTEDARATLEDVAEAEEVSEPDAFISCRTGEIVLVGLEPDEEGRITIPADLVILIRRQTAWSQLP